MKKNLLIFCIATIMVSYSSVASAESLSNEKTEVKIEKTSNIKNGSNKVENKKNYREIDLLELSDIIDIPDSNSVSRVVYSMDKVSFKGMNVPKKKKLFFEIMIPTAMIVREEIEEVRTDLKLMIDGKKEKNEEQLAKLYKDYRVDDKNISTLYKKMKPAPISVLLSQATIESAWGTSRFFEEANNIFGVWSTNPNEPRIKAGQARANKQVYLKKYPTLKGAITDYMSLLARHSAYSEFRAELQKTDDPTLLVPKLDKYSEEGKVYTNKLLASIKQNNLQEYDNYKFK